jgi:hypothetical protein
MLAKALEEDPNVFDYDAAVETDRAAASKGASAAAARAAAAAAAPKQPRYIASILEQAQMRKREQDLITERRLVGAAAGLLRPFFSAWLVAPDRSNRHRQRPCSPPMPPDAPAGKRKQQPLPHACLE